MKSSYIDHIKPGVLKWLESVRFKDKGWGRWKYNTHMCRPYGLQCSGLAIRILDWAGELDNISQEEKRQAVDFFLSCQDPNDGYFKDTLVDDTQWGEHRNSWQEVWHQMSSVIVAVTTLSEKPRFPLPRQQFADLESVDIRKWIHSLDWTNSWRVATPWAWAIISYCKRKELSPGEMDADPRIAEAFKTVEQDIIDPDTGMPTKRGCSDASNAMAGLFKMRYAYEVVGRPFLYPEKALDFTLNLQLNNGEFGYGGDMCINWDALEVLHILDKQLGGTYRRDNIVQSGNLLAQCLLQKYRKSDGGFAFHKNYCLTMHNSVRISAPYPESDMLGTFMCWVSLSYADEWNKRSFEFSSVDQAAMSLMPSVNSTP